MSEKIICGLLLVVGIIHLIPLTGVLGADKLSSLYGLSFEDRNLQILMRHRAILFGLLGAFICYAAFVPAYQPLAFFAAAISITSFFWLAFSVGDYGPAIQKIIIGDMIAAVSLGASVIIYLLNRSSQA